MVVNGERNHFLIPFELSHELSYNVNLKRKFVAKIIKNNFVRCESTPVATHTYIDMAVPLERGSSKGRVVTASETWPRSVLWKMFSAASKHKTSDLPGLKRGWILEYFPHCGAHRWDAPVTSISPAAQFPVCHSASLNLIQLNWLIGSNSDIKPSPSAGKFIHRFTAAASTIQAYGKKSSRDVVVITQSDHYDKTDFTVWGSSWGQKVLKREISGHVASWSNVKP